MTTLQGSCHCGAVRFEVEEPEWVMDCNCSRCRLYGSLWAYYPESEVKFAGAPDTSVYMWGDRMLEFHTCHTCGCATHFTNVDKSDNYPMAVNGRLLRGLDPKRTRLVQKNNGNDMVFWTHTESPVLPSHDEPTSR